MAARDLHTHPAILAGLPETIGAYCWVMWINLLRGAEYEATERKRQLQQTMSDTFRQAAG